MASSKVGRLTFQNGISFEIQLFNLSADPAETRNLQSEYPDVVQDLVADLHHAIKHGRSNSGLPSKNEGWPNTFPAPVLKLFPQLAGK